MTKQLEECTDRGFLAIACSRAVVIRALRIAIIVGLVLAVINHGDKIVNGELSPGVFFKIFVTFFVPYVVSTYSSVLAVRDRDRKS